MIVLKRHQSFTREIFTLVHELGHYLLNEEEVEPVDEQTINFRDKNRIETWCNEFAFYFLAGPYHATLKGLKPAGPQNDYHWDTINQISQRTHLSRLALFTNLLFNDQINRINYNKVKQELKEEYRKTGRRRKRKTTKERTWNKVGRPCSETNQKPALCISHSTSLLQRGT